MSPFNDIRGIDFVNPHSLTSSSSTSTSRTSTSSSSSAFSIPSIPSFSSSSSPSTSSSTASSSSISLKREQFSTIASSSSSQDTSHQGAVTVSEEHERSIHILHQLCAFEQIFHEFFAVLDNLQKPAIRASSQLYYDRKHLFINPLTKRLARRDDDEDTLLLMVHRITRSQRELEGNLIPEYWLEKIESNFILALSNTQVHLRSIPEWNDQVGLFARPSIPLLTSPPADLSANADDKPNKRKRGRRKGSSTSSNYTSKSPVSVSGIEFVLFSFPDTDEDPVDLGFNGQLIFEEYQRGEEYICLGLGMARVINHNCSENVQWKFPTDRMEFNDSIKDVGCLVGKIHKLKKKLMLGDQIFAFYSNNFAKYECQCLNGRLRKGPRNPSSTPVPALSPSTISSIESLPQSIHTPSVTSNLLPTLSDIASVPRISVPRNSSPEEAQSITTFETTISPIKSLTDNDYNKSDEDTKEGKIHDEIISFPPSPSSPPEPPRHNYSRDADRRGRSQLELSTLPARIAKTRAYRAHIFRGTSRNDAIIVDSDDALSEGDSMNDERGDSFEVDGTGGIDPNSGSGAMKNRVKEISVINVEEEITFVKMIKRR